MGTGNVSRPCPFFISWLTEEAHMAMTLKINRQFETIEVENPDGSIACSWQVATDDASLTSMLYRVGNAMDRFAALQLKPDGDAPDEKTKEATVRLLKRTISAIIGEDGYDDVLRYIGDGEPCDANNNIVNIGEVFAALCTWLYEHCSSKQLREAGITFKKAETSNRAQRRKHPKKRK